MVNEELRKKVQRLKRAYDKVRADNQGKSTRDPEAWDLIDRARMDWKAAERALEITEKGAEVQLAILAETQEKLVRMAKKNERSVAEELSFVVSAAYACEFRQGRPPGRPRGAKIFRESLQEAGAET